MVLKVVRIGNSRGVRLPRKVLDRCRVADAVTLEIRGRRIILTPLLRKPREGWNEAAKAMHAGGGDRLLIPDALTDDADWVW